LNFTPKQDAFCLAYIETGNASEAYRRAYNAENVKPKTINRKAKELLDNGMITARFEALRCAVEKKTIVTKAWVLDRLVENVERAMQLVPVIGKGGKPTGEFNYNGSVANKALELLGREFGLFTERKHHIFDDLSKRSDEELEAMIAGKEIEVDRESLH